MSSLDSAYRDYWVYVVAEVGSEPPATKVGISTEPGYRFAALQCGNHRQLRLVETFRLVNKKAALLVERRVQKAFAKERIRGEWFSIDATAALDTITKIAKVYFG